MPRYTVQHAYMSKRDGQQYGPWPAGIEVELHEYDAQWVNRDSPGCLAEVGTEAEEPQTPEQPGTNGAGGGSGDGQSQASGTSGGQGGDADVVPDGTAQVVLNWVGSDPSRARAALEVETAKDAPRSTLVAALEKIAASPLDRQHRASQTRAAGG